ncbi:hypothetical protein HPB52_016139 [Rhipicephalus sanguineus]|uniref:U1 small nuclear ribonucleoprotein of 70kDa N-terminal domain-containing protein n=1 Tax=Rhipicephalus sanguineus TaxID=34632 RepID=A0A9D4T3Y3_RHISA|nr:hypothetical protein HPB52_016139 [Rhipicephalus sanguineus]
MTGPASFSSVCFDPLPQGGGVSVRGAAEEGPGVPAGLDPKDTPPPTRVETREERIERKRREKAEQVAYKLEQDIALWDPYNNSSGTLDPFKTLFVARIVYHKAGIKVGFQ